ncbi:MAG: hypothetical protein ACOCXE_05805 [Spirochaetota bacterium]
MTSRLLEWNARIRPFDPEQGGGLFLDMARYLTGDEDEIARI